VRTGREGQDESPEDEVGAALGVEATVDIVDWAPVGVMSTPRRSTMVMDATATVVRPIVVLAIADQKAPDPFARDMDGPSSDQPPSVGGGIDGSWPRPVR